MKYFNKPPEKYIAELNKYVDYSKHNDMVTRARRAFNDKKPERMLMELGINARYLILNGLYNKSGVDFKTYSENPRVMFEVQTEFRYFLNQYMPFFHEMGNGAPIAIYVDFQNYSEAAWFCCPVLYPDGDVPYAKPLYTEDNREAVFEKGMPEPFGGIFGRSLEYFQAFKEYAKDYEINGKKVDDIYASGSGTDGVFTLACELLGAETACALLYEDEDYMRRLFDFITEATVKRIKAFRKLNGEKEICAFGFADDSIALLSEDMYREAVLPYHKKLADALTSDGNVAGIHLCGDASRHFKTIQDELNCMSFDTGFPIDHEAVLRKLRPGTTMLGGPPVAFLEKASPAEVYNKVKEMALRLKKVSKYFIMREANNLPPSVPLTNVLAMYRAVAEYGVYD